MTAAQNVATLQLERLSNSAAAGIKRNSAITTKYDYQMIAESAIMYF